MLNVQCDNSYSMYVQAAADKTFCWHRGWEVPSLGVILDSDEYAQDDPETPQETDADVVKQDVIKVISLTIAAKPFTTYHMVLPVSCMNLIYLCACNLRCNYLVYFYCCMNNNWY